MLTTGLRAVRATIPADIGYISARSCSQRKTAIGQDAPTVHETPKSSLARRHSAALPSRLPQFDPAVCPAAAGRRAPCRLPKRGFEKSLGPTLAHLATLELRPGTRSLDFAPALGRGAGSDTAEPAWKPGSEVQRDQMESVV